MVRIRDEKSALELETRKLIKKNHNLEEQISIYKRRLGDEEQVNSFRENSHLLMQIEAKDAAIKKLKEDINE